MRWGCGTAFEPDVERRLRDSSGFLLVHNGLQRKEPGMADLRTDRGASNRIGRHFVLVLVLFAVAAEAVGQQVGPGAVNNLPPANVPSGPMIGNPAGPMVGSPVAAPLAAPVGAQFAPPGAPPGPAQAAASASGASQEMVVDVQIRGNKALPLSKILPHIRTRTGRPFDLERIEEDVRRLDHTHMFVNVKTFSQQVPGGRIVIFDVVERPLLTDVLFLGCGAGIHQKTLRKEADIKKGDPVDPFAIEEARRKLEEFYHTKGFSNARITLLEGNKPEDRRAIFLIDEGTKQRIWKVKFIGNTIATDDRLQTQIKSKPPFLVFFKGELDRKQLDEDRELLTAYYRGLGFFRARIGSPLVEFDEKEDWATVTFVIDEGPRYKIRNVSVIGNSKYSNDQLMADLKLNNGAYFNQSKMNKDVSLLQDKYGGIGYVFADIKADPRFLEEANQLDLVYNIKEGDRYRVGKINVQIKGEYPHTQITTILNRMSLKPGDIVDIREIRASERRIKQSGLFEANPATGNPPKIVFSPPGQETKDPEEDNKTEVANKPKMGRGPGPNFRGQSPDSDSRDRDLDLDVWHGRYIGPPPATPEPAVNASQTNGDAQFAPVGGALQAGAPREDDLARAAGELSQALSQNRQSPQSRERLIPTQYTSDVNAAPAPVAPATSQWTSAPAAPAQSPATAIGQQPAPVQPAPAYGQDLWPRQGGPEQPVYGPQGPYQPGPIFNESSPFRDGPPTGDLAAPLPFNVTADEAMTGRLMFGVGINSDAGLVGSIVLDEQNFDWTRFPTSWEDVRNATAFRGAGQRFRLEAMPGTQVQRYAATFQEPYLFNTPVALSLSGFYFTRIYTEYTEQRLGGRVGLGYQFAPDLSGTVAYQGAKINITNPEDPTIPDFAEVLHRNLAMHDFQFILTRNKRDSDFLPTEGHFIEASFEEVLGSYEYQRGQLDMRKYFTLYERPDGSGRQVLTLAARAGVESNNTPVYDRFYAGGVTTIRGFQFRDASPLSPGTDVVVGGNFMLMASAEYMFPITADDMLRGVVFCDSGTVEPTSNNWNNNYRVAPGFGLRICVPALGAAPIALDFAFPISWQHGDKQEMFSFFMGFGR
jgi:outer membrane protein insertion porin family